MLSTARPSGTLLRMVVIARHRAVLERLHLGTVAEVKAFSGPLVKNHRGHRDILRIVTTDDDGKPLTLFLKRNWKPYRKDGLISLLRHGRVWSVSRQEWANGLALEEAGLRTAPRVAYGEECGPAWEKFSFILTEAADGRHTIRDFLRDCHDAARRRRVLDALAVEIGKMHAAGLASPDLFTRHLFVEDAAARPRFCLIDMARLDARRSLSMRHRARDLAALHVTAPLRLATVRERLRFARIYAGHDARALLKCIGRRTRRLLKRRKFRDFFASADSDDTPSRMASEQARHRGAERGGRPSH
ncbi:MAG TPA: lipopolysaccharide kinase InaA family protein [Verrucomicrobiota bacterium]|nr:lipopolysaccharide kinase InaA family protein [Verrucomicrobiota bacterium]